MKTIFLLLLLLVSQSALTQATILIDANHPYFRLEKADLRLPAWPAAFDPYYSQELWKGNENSSNLLRDFWNTPEAGIYDTSTRLINYYQAPFIQTNTWGNIILNAAIDVLNIRSNQQIELRAGGWNSFIN